MKRSDGSQHAALAILTCLDPQGKFKEIFEKKYPDVAKSANPEEEESFVKNAHHLRVLRGKQLGAFDKDREALGAFPSITAGLRSYADMAT